MALHGTGRLEQVREGHEQPGAAQEHEVEALHAQLADVAAKLPGARRAMAEQPLAQPLIPGHVLEKPEGGDTGNYTGLWHSAQMGVLHTQDGAQWDEMPSTERSPWEAQHVPCTQQERRAQCCTAAMRWQVQLLHQEFASSQRKFEQLLEAERHRWCVNLALHVYLC